MYKRQVLGVVNIATYDHLWWSGIAIPGKMCIRDRAVDTTAPCRREGWDEIQIKLGGCITPRLDTLFARQLGISRSRVKRLCEREVIRGPEGKAEANARVREDVYKRQDLYL